MLKWIKLQHGSRVLDGHGIPQIIFGHTVFQEILNVRLQRVKELLSTTDLTIKEIAVLSGFSYSEHLMRVFHDRFGQTMNEFRKNYRTK